MPIAPIMIIKPEYNGPVVGIIAGTKFCMNGNIPPKTVNKANAIVTNFSAPKSMLLRTPYNNPITPTAMIMNW